MNPIEKKLDAIMRYLTANNKADQDRAYEDMTAMVNGSAEPVVATGRSVESETRRTLLELGVPDHIKGHRYLVKAVCLTVADPGLLDAITKELYPAVGAAFDTTKQRAERAIRHAIELAWERCDWDTLMRYFGNTVSADKGTPTNSEFIARISNVVRQYVK